MTTLNFSQCTLLKLDDLFALEQVDDLPPLRDWLADRPEISDSEAWMLRLFQRNLKQYVHDWNDVELRQHFIGPMFTLVDFASKKIGLFSERPLSGQVDGVALQGTPDGLIASGFRQPKQPYFCFQEYKRQRDPNGDPAGQCLAAMLVGQVLNHGAHPIYGCYVIGTDWYFMAVADKHYSISPAYVATRDDIFDIFRTLKALKELIMQIVDQDSE